MGRVKSNHDPLRTVLGPLASAVILLVLTGWVGLAHQPEPEVLSGALVVPALREALRMITLIPSEIHHDLLNALGSTLLTLALAGGGILIVVLKSTTEISPAKSRLFTLLSSWWDPRDATCAVRESNWRRTASHPYGHARTAVLCEPMLSGSNHHHAGGRHRMVDLGRHQRSRLRTPNFQTKLS